MAKRPVAKNTKARQYKYKLHIMEDMAVDAAYRIHTV